MAARRRRSGLVWRPNQYKLRPKLRKRLITKAQFYDPLEEHPDWTFEGGQIPAPSHLYYEFGSIVAKRWVSGGGIQMLCYNNVYTERAIFEADVVYSPTSTMYWSIPFAKQVDLNNLVGARINEGEIQIAQRSGGTWSNIATAPAQTGHWRVIITDTDITVYVDGVEALTVSHAISGPGYMGISGHQMAEEIEICKNYSVKPFLIAFPFNNDLTDQQGYASVVGSAGITYADVNGNTGAVFNGTNARVQYTPFIPLPITVFFKIYIDDATSEGIIFSLGDSVCVFQQAGKICAEPNSSNILEETSQSDDVVQAGETYDIIIQFTDYHTKPIMMVNGVRQRNEDAMDYWSAPLFSFGARNFTGNWSRFWKGTILDFMAFPGALLQALDPEPITYNGSYVTNNSEVVTHG